MGRSPGDEKQRSRLHEQNTCEPRAPQPLSANTSWGSEPSRFIPQQEPGLGHDSKPRLLVTATGRGGKAESSAAGPAEGPFLDREGDKPLPSAPASQIPEMTLRTSNNGTDGAVRAP